MRAGNRWALVMATAGLTVAAGCGGKADVSSSTEEARVKGRVTIKGKAPKAGRVVFDPANYRRKDAPARTADLAADGSYAITTLVGENFVSVSGPEAEKAGAAYERLSYDVPAGESTFDIALPPPGQP